MGQPSVPPQQAASSGGGGGGVGAGLGGSCQVRCAGCHWILTVGAGMMEFSCPKCQLPQMLPPEMMRVQAQGIDPTKIQLPCVRCKAILNVPHGLTRFSCPQCGVDLAIDPSKLPHYFPSPSPSINFNLNPPPPLVVEEVNEVTSSSSQHFNSICNQPASYISIVVVCSNFHVSILFCFVCSALSLSLYIYLYMYLLLCVPCFYPILFCLL